MVLVPIVGSCMIRMALPRFRFELLPTIVLLVVLAVTLSAGRWQLGRAEHKRELSARIEAASVAAPVVLDAGSRDADALRFRQVLATGVFDGRYAIHLDNRIRNGIVGYELLVPLRLADGRTHVLVNRGWIAAGPRRDVLPEAELPPGTVSVRGTAVESASRFLELAPEVVDGPRWQNVTVERVRERHGIDLLPLIVQQTEPLPGGGDARLLREWPRPDAGVDKHLGYALQWFSFAAIAVIVYLALGFRRERTSTGTGRP